MPITVSREVAEMVRALAKARGIKLSEAASHLISVGATRVRNLRTYSQGRGAMLRRSKAAEKAKTPRKRKNADAEASDQAQA